MGITLRELLSSYLFRNDLQLIAGTDGIGREISHISIIDTPLVPLPPYMLDDNVFVLSSFYLYRDDSNMMLEAVKNLNILGASALGIKTDMYVHDIPESVIKYCDRHSFPLFVTVSENIPFRKIISSVEEQIKSSRNTADDVALFDGFIHGKTKSTFMRIVEDSFPINFICLTCDRRTIFKNIVSSYPSLHELELAAQSFLGELPDTSNKDILRIGNSDFYALPCYIRGNLEAVFVFYCPDPVMPYDLKKTARTLSALICLQLMESILQETGQQQAAANFMSDLLLAEYSSEEHARQKFRALGYPNYLFYRIMLCTGINSNENSSFFLAKNSRSIVSSTILAYFPGSLCLDSSGAIVAVIPIKENSKYKADKVFENTLQTLIDNLASVPNLEIVFSQLQTELSRCSYVYRHLHSASDTSLTRSGPYLKLVKDYDVMSLVLAAIDSNQHTGILDHIISPLESYDRQYNYSLLDTLLVCTNAHSLQSAAAELHIHSSTLRYRLQKIYELLGYNFFDFQDRMILLVACILYMMHKNQM